MAETETETDRCVRDRETGRDGAAQGSEVGTEVLARVPVPASQAPGQGMPRGACLPVQLALPESQAQGACGFAEGWDSVGGGAGELLEHAVHTGVGQEGGRWEDGQLGMSAAS